MLVRLSELIADISRDARFDSASTKSDLEKPNREQDSWLNRVRDRRTYQRQRGVAAAIDDR